MLSINEFDKGNSGNQDIRGTSAARSVVHCQNYTERGTEPYTGKTVQPLTWYEGCQVFCESPSHDRAEDRRHFEWTAQHGTAGQTIGVRRKTLGCCRTRHPSGEQRIQYSRASERIDETKRIARRVNLGRIFPLHLRKYERPGGGPRHPPQHWMQALGQTGAAEEHVVKAKGDR